LEPLYEQQFLDVSYGFRPGRSAHQALDALWRITPEILGVRHVFYARPVKPGASTRTS
jgi:hypothetical protein